MKRIQKLLAFAVLLNASLFSLKYDPWFGNLMEFHLEGKYMFQHYPGVDGAVNPSSYSSTDNFLGGEFYVRFLPQWEGLVEAEWNTTKQHDMRFLSTAMQARYQLLDDIEGDPLSFTLMGDVRYVPTHALKDVSTPYHAQCNIEAGASIGKELDFGSAWAHLIYATGLIGQANRGYPWIRPILHYQATYKGMHSIGGVVDGYFGLGNRDTVNVDDFSGYAKINHRSVDIGIFYKYAFRLWGTFQAQYARRVYAKSYPRDNNMLYLRYTLPFSLL